MSSAPAELKSSGWVSVPDRKFPDRPDIAVFESEVVRRDIVRSAPHPAPLLELDSMQLSDADDYCDEQISYEAAMDQLNVSPQPLQEVDDEIKGLDEEFDDILTSPRDTAPNLLQKRSRSLPNLAPSAKQNDMMRLSLSSPPRKVELIVEDHDSLSPARGEAARCSICSTDGPSAAAMARESRSISQIFSSSWGSSKSKGSLLSMPSNLQVSNTLSRTATNSNSSQTSRGSGSGMSLDRIRGSPTDRSGSPLVPLVLDNLESFPQLLSDDPDDELAQEDEQRISDILLQASEYGEIELITYFLQVGNGKIDAKEALTRAATRGHLQAAQVLVEHVWSKSSVFRASRLAAEKGHKHVAKFLKQRGELVKKTFKRSFSREESGLVAAELMKEGRQPAKSLGSLRRLLDANKPAHEDFQCLVRSAASTGNVLGMKYFMEYRELSDPFVGKLLETAAGAVCDGSAYQMVRLLLEGRGREVQARLPAALVEAVKAHHLYTASFIAGRFPELPDNETMEDKTKEALDNVVQLAIKRDKKEIIQSICECRECNRIQMNGVTGKYMPKLFRDTVWGQTFECALYLFERLQMGKSMIQVARNAHQEELAEEMETGLKRREQLVLLATTTTAKKTHPFSLPKELWRLIAEYTVHTIAPPPVSAGFQTGPNSLVDSASLPPSLTSTRTRSSRLDRLSLATTDQGGRPSRPSLSRSP